MSSALAIRRRCVIWAPLVSGLLIVAAFFLDPDIGASGRKLAKSYAENPGWIQASAVCLRFAFAFLIIPAFWPVAAVRERGAWLANVAGVFVGLGMTTLPGFLLTDFYDVAIYGQLGGDAWERVDDRLGELPGAIFIFLTGLRRLPPGPADGAARRLAREAPSVVARGRHPRGRGLRAGRARRHRAPDLVCRALRPQLRALSSGPAHRGRRARVGEAARVPAIPYVAMR
jgi:hypothetical protein